MHHAIGRRRRRVHRSRFYKQTDQRFEGVDIDVCRFSDPHPAARALVEHPFR
jgi:hypothetical protein